MVTVTDCHPRKGESNTVTVLLRGSNKLVLEEADRSLHDAFCVVRCLVKKGFLISGGGSAEIEISMKVAEKAKALLGAEHYAVKAFAECFEVVPFTLAENAGLPPIATVTELRNQHLKGKTAAGINVRKGIISDMYEENVVQPLLVTSSAITLAAECCSMILKIDEILMCR